jgi:hypothetical protein
MFGAEEIFTGRKKTEYGANKALSISVGGGGFEKRKKRKRHGTARGHDGSGKQADP